MTYTRFVTVFLVAMAFAPPVLAGECQGHVRIALIADLTRSTEVYKVPAVTVESVARLLDLLEVCGSFDLGVGVVSANGSDWFPTVSIGARPQTPAAPLYERNAFVRGRQRRAYEQQLTAHRSELLEWTRTAAAKRAKFTRELTEALGGPHGNVSDVFGALQRTATFFDEDRAFAGRVSKRLLVAVSDLHDNQKRAFEGLPADVITCVVNGVGTTGVLRQRRALRFGAIEPMLDFVRVWRMS